MRIFSCQYKTINQMRSAMDFLRKRQFFSNNYGPKRLQYKKEKGTAISLFLQLKYTEIN